MFYFSHLLFNYFFSRTDIMFSRDGTNGPILKVPVLQIVGARSAFIHDTVFINSKLDPSMSDYIKVQDSCGLVLDDRPDAITGNFDGSYFSSNFRSVNVVPTRIGIL